MSLPIHYLEQLGTTAPCGEVPGLSTSDPDTVSCLVCRLVIGQLVMIRTSWHPFRFVCSSCEQPTTRLTTDPAYVEYWTRLLRMGFPLLCSECCPDPDVTLRVNVRQGGT